MAYPKPLSEKSIARMYACAGLKEEQIAFLHAFFLACANLYGVIAAKEAWGVYRELSEKTETVRLHRKDMYAALEILRREELPYYVFEADELYSEEARRDELRIIVHRELVSFGFGKFSELYSVEENAAGKPFYVPRNLLSFTVMPKSLQEQKLLKLLNGLKSTRSHYKNIFGRTVICPYKGKYLREFSYISEHSRFELSRLRGEIEGYRGNPIKAEELEAKLKSVTAAQYLVNKLKRENSIGDFKTTYIIDNFFEDLTAMGVALSDKNQVKELFYAVYEMCNNQHLWCNHGYTPNEIFTCP